MNYDNTNQGALFKNDKQGNERWPDYKGTINVNGTEYWISAWLKSSKSGQKYMSLSVQPKQRGANPKGEDQQKQNAAADFDDSIPF